MKPKYLAALFSALLVWPAVSSQAAVSVSVFYDSLDPYGEWVSTGDYGYVFRPSGVEADWRPYTDGSWVYTDAGWTWTSEEPFGWATYHYGRWADLDGTGWVWVPGTEWGPAWVSWRSSDDYVGWAPLPPEARFEARLGFHDWVDTHFEIGPASFSFVRFQDFGADRLRTVVVQPRENITIINNTRNITNITYVNNVVVNNGPKFDVVSKRSSKPIRQFKLERNRDVAFTGDNARGGLRAQIQGNTLRIPAPDVQPGEAAAAPKKVARKLDRVAVNRGWKNAGDPAKVQEVRAKMASEAKAPADLPKVKFAGSDDATAPTGRPATAEGKPNRGERPDATGATPPADRPGVAVGEPNPQKPERGQRPGQKQPRVGTPDGNEPPAAGEAPTPNERRGPGGKRPGPDGVRGGEERPDANRVPGKPPIPQEAPAPTDAQRGPAEKPARPEVDRPERPERPQRPDQGRPERSERPERPGINREERGDRPNAGAAERQRPDAGRTDKPGLPPRPEVNRERPNAGAGERPPQKNPKGADAEERKEGKEGREGKERGPSGKEGGRKDE